MKKQLSTYDAGNIGHPHAKSITREKLYDLHKEN